MTTQIAPAARQRLLPPETGRAGFGDALRSEFTKIRSTRSTYWTLLALVVVSVGIGALASAGAASHANESGKDTFDATQQSLAGLYVGQLVIAVLVLFLLHSWHDNVHEWLRALAGSQVWAVKTSPGAHQFPPWGGFAVLAGYVAIAVVAGLILFRPRDA